MANTMTADIFPDPDEIRAMEAEGFLFSEDKKTLYKAPRAHDETIVIPRGVSVIGRDAFYRHYGLERVIIPDTVTEIGDHAFNGCMHLTEVVIPDSVKKSENLPLKKPLAKNSSNRIIRICLSD